MAGTTIVVGRLVMPAVAAPRSFSGGPVQTARAVELTPVVAPAEPVWVASPRSSCAFCWLRRAVGLARAPPAGSPLRPASCASQPTPSASTPRGICGTPTHDEAPTVSTSLPLIFCGVWHPRSVAAVLSAVRASVAVCVKGVASTLD